MDFTLPEVALMVLVGVIAGLLPSTIMDRRGVRLAADIGAGVTAVFAAAWLLAAARDLIPLSLDVLAGRPPDKKYVDVKPGFEPVVLPLAQLKPLLKPVVHRSRDEICEALVRAAEINDLPVPFFIRLLYQESTFRPAAISMAGAQGIAQFMPETAADRRLDNPFDPALAIPASAHLLRDHYRRFGNLGLAAAAYNAGPGRVREFLSARRPLPAETRNYVLAITGIPVDEWAASGKREPKPVPKAGCGELMALLHRAPNPFIEKLEQRVNVVAAAPWGVQLAAGFSRDHALSNYAMLAKRYANVLQGHDPSLLSTLLRSRGTQTFYQVRVGADTRAAAESLCGNIRRAGGACFVLRNRG